MVVNIHINVCPDVLEISSPNPQKTTVICQGFLRRESKHAKP